MIIDTHFHHMPSPLNSDFVSWLSKTGDRSFGPSYLWDKPAFEDTSHMLEKMDACSVDVSVVTYSANMTAILQVAQQNGMTEMDATRHLNDDMLRKKKETGGRLLPTAWVNPCMGKAAVKEMVRVADQGFAGFSVLTAYQQDGVLKFIDHADFAEFWAQAAECELPVFIHFSSLFSAGQREYLSGYMAYTLLHAGMEQLVEDTLCATRLILSGLFDRHPNLRVIMGQLGGLFPFMLERFDMLYGMYAMGAQKAGLEVMNRDNSESFLRKLSDYTDNLYVDTHSMGQHSIEAAIHILGEDKVLYGSDYPITPDNWGRDRGLAIIRDLSVPETVKSKVLGSSAKVLLHL